MISNEDAFAINGVVPSHLVHELREFSGLTPGTWLASVGAYPRHVPIDPDVSTS